MNNFKDLGILSEIVDSLDYSKPTDIQSKSISPLIDGKDLLGVGQTGTGKTAAFTLPLITKCLKNRVDLSATECRFLIVVPTRELASQIETSIISYSTNKVSSSTIIGGVNREQQVRSVSSGKDFVVGTPGRLLDLLRGGELSLQKLESLVLDEADMMLDYGFLEDVENILSFTHSTHQTILFSATMPSAITQLANSILNNPVRVEAQKESTISKSISEKLYFVDEANKNFLLCSLLSSSESKKVIVFCKAKYGVAIVVDALNNSEISCTEIHSNRSQTERDQAIVDFSESKVRVLVATDIAARGIDVSNVSHVINYNLPEDASYYVHRVGRTARAGKSGEALSLCTEKELPLLRNIQKSIKRDLPLVSDHPFHVHLEVTRPKKKRRRRR